MTRKELGEKVFKSGNVLLVQCYLSEYGRLNPEGEVGRVAAEWWKEALEGESEMYEEDLTWPAV